MVQTQKDSGVTTATRTLPENSAIQQSLRLFLRRRNATIPNTDAGNSARSGLRETLRIMKESRDR